MQIQRHPILFIWFPPQWPTPFSTKDLFPSTFVAMLCVFRKNLGIHGAGMDYIRSSYPNDSAQKLLRICGDQETPLYQRTLCIIGDHLRRSGNCCQKVAYSGVIHFGRANIISRNMAFKH